MYIVKRISILTVSVILTVGIVFSILQAQTTHAFSFKNALCTAVGADCRHHSKSEKIAYGDSHGSADVLKKEGEVIVPVSGIINSDLAKERIFKHKHTNKVYPYDMFERISGKVYKDKVSGRYLSEHQLEEVRGADGYYNAVDNEIVVGHEYEESVEHIFRNDKANYYASGKDHVNSLEKIIQDLRGKLQEERKKAGVRY